MKREGKGGEGERSVENRPGKQGRALQGIAMLNDQDMA